MAEKFRMAFVGAGNRANQVHYPSFANLPDVEIAGICDIDPERLKRTSEKYGVAQEKRWGDTVYAYRDMLQTLKPDGVAVIGPPHVMFDIWTWVLSQGINLYIEKPMGITAHQARVLHYLAEKNGSVAAVALQRRVTPVVMRLREKCLEHGPVTHALVRFYKCERREYLNARGHMMDDCVHSIDTLRWVFGDREIVRIDSKCLRIGVHDINYISASLEFEGGGMGYLLNSWSSGRRIFDIEMHSPGACAEAEHETGGTFYENGDTKGVYISSSEAAGSEQFHVYTGVENLARDFVDCCRDRSRTLVSPFSNAVKTMETAEKILAQAILSE